MAMHTNIFTFPEEEETCIEQLSTSH